MKTGKIKWFHTDKGYGFIEQDDRASDAFLHHSELVKIGLADIRQDQKVSFDLESKKDRTSAVNIKLI